tara:strand:+ start:29 stop:514 length:486 start_codon:yes stop_codon:yes gene_type:complete
MEAILKFFENTSHKPSGSPDGNEVISRTLLKIAVVSRHFRQKHGPDAVPKHGELWRCTIVKEIKSGQNKGCFIVEPLQKVDDNSLTHLIPGWYDVKLVNGRLLIYPRKQGINWILPLTHKRIMSEENKAYCVIVTLDSLPITEVPEGTPLPSPDSSLTEDQ